MRYLALDIGTRRTGCAYLDSDVGIPLPLDTIRHMSVRELLEAVRAIVDARGVTEVIVGMPLLPSGDKGSQAAFATDVGERLRATGLAVRFVDERYTTPKASDENRGVDGDAAAACQLLSVIS